ncbi:MAG: glycerol-3-phosphate acyltransferase [Candidatus Heimdallarchaeota archaeon]
MSFANIWPFFVSPLIGLLLGSFPTAYIVTKLVAGVDPREFGSGSVSTRNTIRAAGLWPWGAVTFSVDGVKGMIAAAIVEYTIAPLSDDPGKFTQFYVILCAIAAVAGHCWMPYLKFKGGKGLGTFAGLFLFLYWPLAIWWFIVMFSMIKLSGFSGIGACWGAALIAPFMFFIDQIAGFGTFTYGLPLAFWPHIYFTDGEMGWPFILLYAMGMWLVLTLRHIPEFKKIKRGDAAVWKSLKTTEMLK